MSIYRGSGGSGDATSDATINEVTELVQDAFGYKNEAATSASNAATSASNAATSESNASTSETNASSSASDAATSETNAATSEINAATSATSASTSESNASTSETNATASATSASSSASSASSSASSAAGSATTATTKASEAATSASNASTSETNASNSASAASTSATNASTSESNAATSATNAASSASAAATSATEAAASAASIDTSSFVVKSNNLSDLDSASSARTNLGLIIGTNVQAQSALLDDVVTENSIGRKNYIINGNFDIWQKGDSGTATGFIADRWYSQTSNAGAVGTVSKVAFALGQTDVLGSPKYYARHDRTTAATAGNVVFGQRIEDVTNLAGKTITVSLYARDDEASDFNVDLLQVFGTGGSPSSNVTVGVQTLSSTTSWAKYTFTFTVPSIAGKTLGTDNNDYLYLRIVNTSGVLGTFRLDIAQVQIEEGSVATDFEYRPIGEELALCQRYYQELGLGFTGANASSTIVRLANHYMTTMRNTPTISLTDTSISLNASGLVTSTGSTVTVISSDNEGVLLTINGFTGLTAAQPAVSRQNFLALDAEL